MRVFLLLATLSVAACGTTTSFTSLNPHPYGGGTLDVSSVELLTTRPERGYTELGIIEVGEASVYAHAETTEIFEELRKEAARRGCNAVLVRGTDNQTETDLLGDYTRSLDGWWGVCLVYDRTAAARR